MENRPKGTHGIGDWVYDSGEVTGTATDIAQFGSALRTERERRGTTLEELSGWTKLSVRQLEDIEAGNYAALPRGVFRKGFVRSYLNALELEVEPWLKRFEKSCAASCLNTGDELEWASFAANVKNNRVAVDARKTPLHWLGVVGMAIAVLIAVWGLWVFVVRSRVEASSGAIAGHSAQYREFRADSFGR